MYRTGVEACASLLDCPASEVVKQVTVSYAIGGKPDPRPEEQSPQKFWPLVLGSIGVVYGDIGTSPLYAFKEAVSAAHGQGIDNREIVFGVLSLILWALLLIVTFKYVWLLLRADNKGEGGTFALMALSQQASKRSTKLLLLLGIAGAAFFYGDAAITPAISVVSAVEGLKLVHPHLSKVVVPLSILILFVLFWMQSRGTERVAKLFGPITVAWFLVLAAGGFIHIFDDPSVLAAINPVYGVSFLMSNGLVGLTVLGLVFLSVTGAEALYADLGHFGRKPIQFAWIWFVLPALVLNYFGQGALVLANPHAIEGSFYKLYPDWALIPMVLLATIATIIASQAVISGAFSLTRQAIQLGLLPRLHIQHTSETMSGQIYMPRVNWALFVVVVVLVLTFKTSSGLATAYGISVTATMVITSLMAMFVVWRLWGWNLWAAMAVIFPLIIIEQVFFVANMLKFLDGGWMPMLIAGTMAFAMITWRAGTKVLIAHERKKEGDITWLARKLQQGTLARVSGTAVFMTATPEVVPTALMHNLKHNKVLHDRNIIMAIKTEETPRVPRYERVEVKRITDQFYVVTARYGFMELPSMPKIIEHCRRKGVNIEMPATSFFLSRRSLKSTRNKGLPRWQQGAFIWMTSVAADATGYFRIPTDRVVEIGTQVEI